MLHLIHKLSQASESLFIKANAGSDLTPRQYTVLSVIRENEGISQTGLVDYTGIDRSTMTGIVRRLQLKKLVTRRRTKNDARLYATMVTDKGIKLLDEIDPIAKLVDKEILDALPANQRHIFQLCLAHLTASLEKCVSNKL